MNSLSIRSAAARFSRACLFASLAISRCVTAMFRSYRMKGVHDEKPDCAPNNDYQPAQYIGLVPLRKSNGLFEKRFGIGRHNIPGKHSFQVFRKFRCGLIAIIGIGAHRLIANRFHRFGNPSIDGTNRLIFVLFGTAHHFFPLIRPEKEGCW